MTRDERKARMAELSRQMDTPMTDEARWVLADEYLELQNAAVIEVFTGFAHAVAAINLQVREAAI